MMPAEIRAAGQRLDREKVLPPLPRATVTVAVDGVGLWEMPGRVSKEPLWLQLVASASPRQLGVSGWVGAGYVGWRWRAGRIQRIAIPLPRTSAEGLWSCLSLQPKAAIDCRFDPGGLPGARAFSPRLLSLSPAGDLGPLHRRGRE
jgi:hypothetical protein